MGSVVAFGLLWVHVPTLQNVQCSNSSPMKASHVSSGLSDFAVLAVTNGFGSCGVSNSLAQNGSLRWHVSAIDFVDPSTVEIRIRVFFVIFPGLVYAKEHRISVIILTFYKK